MRERADCLPGVAVMHAAMGQQVGMALLDRPERGASGGGKLAEIFARYSRFSFGQPMLSGEGEQMPGKIETSPERMVA